MDRNSTQDYAEIYKLCDYYGIPAILRAMESWCLKVADKWDDIDMKTECYKRANLLGQLADSIGTGE